MEFTYDSRYNVAYLRLKEPAINMETIRISDVLNIDISPDGTIYGIEFLNAIEQIGRLPELQLKAVNEASGQSALLKFP